MMQFVLGMLAAITFLAVQQSHAQAPYIDVLQEQQLQTSVPKGAQRVALLTLSITAPCSDDVILRHIRLKHEGLGSVQDIDRIYALNGFVRKTSGRSFTSNGFTTLHFRQTMIPACETMELQIAADFSQNASAGSQHSVRLLSAQDFAVRGDAEVYLRNMQQVKRVQTQVIAYDTGTVNVEYRRLTTPVRYGKNRIVSRFVLEPDLKHNQKILQLTLTNNGSVQGNELRNIFITNSRREPLSTVISTMDGDKATFFFDNLVLEKGKSYLFQMRGDVHASSRETVQFIFDEPSDIVAIPCRGRCQ